MCLCVKGTFERTTSPLLVLFSEQCWVKEKRKGIFLTENILKVMMMMLLLTDDDDVHLHYSCCCHRRSSLNGQVGCRASRSRDNWSCQHNLRKTYSPGFSRDTIASWAHYIFSHQPTSWLWTNRTLSTFQVLTKLARLDPSHALRVPTRACCVVPSGRFF